jgi:hypothetical protein
VVDKILGSLGLRKISLADGNIVENSLQEDDANTHMLCHVWQELSQQVIDWIESIAREDTLCRGGAV